MKYLKFTTISGLTAFVMLFGIGYVEDHIPTFIGGILFLIGVISFFTTYLSFLRHLYLIFKIKRFNLAFFLEILFIILFSYLFKSYVHSALEFLAMPG